MGTKQARQKQEELLANAPATWQNNGPNFPRNAALKRHHFKWFAVPDIQAAAHETTLVWQPLVAPLSLQKISPPNETYLYHDPAPRLVPQRKSASRLLRCRMAVEGRWLQRASSVCLPPTTLDRKRFLPQAGFRKRKESRSQIDPRSAAPPYFCPVRPSRRQGKRQREHQPTVHHQLHVPDARLWRDSVSGNWDSRRGAAGGRSSGLHRRRCGGHVARGIQPLNGYGVRRIGVGTIACATPCGWFEVDPGS